MRGSFEVGECLPAKRSTGDIEGERHCQVVLHIHQQVQVGAENPSHRHLKLWMRIDEQVCFFLRLNEKETVHWEFMKGGGLMMTMTLWNQNNRLMVIRDEKAITWTVGKH